MFLVNLFWDKKIPSNILVTILNICMTIIFSVFFNGFVKYRF